MTPQPAIPVTYEPRPPLLQVDAKAVAKELLTTKQYTCLNKLLSKESAWNPEAQNPTSTASGIGQILDTTYQGLGMKKTDTGVTQLVATLSYIHRRWVTPCNAYANFKNKGWY